MHFGAAWPYPFGLIVQAKVTDAQMVRKIALEGHRFTPQEALKCGLVDHIVQGDTEAVLHKAQEVATVVGAQAQGGAWGLIRVSLSLGSRRARRSSDVLRSRAMSMVRPLRRSVEVASSNEGALPWTTQKPRLGCDI